MGPPMIKSEMGQLTGWIYVELNVRSGLLRASSGTKASASTGHLGYGVVSRGCGAAHSQEQRHGSDQS